MKTVAIVQARMGSTRLPGKVLLDLGGQTVLGRVVERLRDAKLLNETVVATTTLLEDDVIEKECNRLGLRCFRGSRDDVLDRYYHASQTNAADLIVRVTADCPAVDPGLVDASIELQWSSCADYVATDVPATIPRGNDVEVFTAMSLERCWGQASEPHQREHVTPYFYEHAELFRLAALKSELDCREYRWTLDTREDLGLLREIYREFHGIPAFSWRDVVDLMQRRPELLEWNAQVAQKPLK